MQNTTENRTALTHTTENAGQLVPTSHENGSIMARVLELAANPNVNIDMFDRLVAWQEREQARQAMTVFNEALASAQAEIAPVVRTALNPQTKSRYAKLEHVDEIIRPIYTAHGFSISFNTVPPLEPGNIRVACRVAKGGHVETYHWEAKPDTLGPQGSKVKTELHGGGSTITYLKRYIVCGVFNVVYIDEDTDGAARGRPFEASATKAALRGAGQEASEGGAWIVKVCHQLATTKDGNAWLDMLRSAALACPTAADLTVIMAHASVKAARAKAPPDIKGKIDTMLREAAMRLGVPPSDDFPGDTPIEG